MNIVLNEYAKCYRQDGDLKKARVYDFLANCSDDDFREIFDSGVLNYIAKGYLNIALSDFINYDDDDGELEIDAEEREKAASLIRIFFNRAFSEFDAKQAEQRY